MIKYTTPRFELFYPKSFFLLAIIKLIVAKMKRYNLSENDNIKTLIPNMEVRFTSSYRVGLYHTLKVMNLPKGSKILMTPITIFDQLNIVNILGLIPVFVDIAIDTHSISIEDLENKIDTEARCIIVTYLSGISFDFSELNNIAKKNNLYIIEDFSQNIHSSFSGKLCGTRGDVGIASLSVGKLITTGHGGLMFINNPLLIDGIDTAIKEDNISPPKSQLLRYLFSGLLIQIITNEKLYKHFFSKLIILLKINLDEYSSKDPKKTIFKIFTKEILVKLPKKYFTFFTSYQFELFNVLLNDSIIRTQERKKKGKLLLSLLCKEIQLAIPTNCFNDGNSFYHLPLKSKSPEKLKSYLYKHGIDVGGYGLPIISGDEKFINSIQIKNNIIFVPINESFDLDRIKQLAVILNHSTELI